MTAAGAPAAVGLEAARAHTYDVVNRSGTSFGLGMRVLSKARRDAMFALYAYCREIDDIADEAGTEQEKLAALDEWRTEIGLVYESVPSKPTALALLGPVRIYDLPQREFLLLIEGMEMDARGPVRAPTRQMLGTYCRRVAGAVGMISIRIFGDSSPAAERFALALGDALQLTNILRDVADDAAIGRLYLPRELLASHGIATHEPADVLNHPAIGAACRDLAREARGRFQDARLALTELDWRVMRPALIMMGMYEGLLGRMEADGWRKGFRPVKLSRPGKILRALRYALAPPLRGPA